MSSYEFERLSRAASVNESQYNMNDNLQNDGLEPEPEYEMEDSVQKIDTRQLKNAGTTETALKLAEQTAKRNADAESEMPEENEYDDGSRQSEQFIREVPRSDTRAQTRTVGRKPVKDANLLQIRDFPASLMKMIKDSMGAESVSNKIALIAFVYANRDPDFDSDYKDVPEEAIILAKQLDKFKTVNNVNRVVDKMDRKVSKLMKQLSDVSRGVGFLISDRCGFNPPVNSDTRPSDLNFKFRAIDEIMTNIEKTNDEISEQRAIAEGKPFK